MTIQLRTTRHGVSKAALEMNLNHLPDRVEFHDPSVINERTFRASDWPKGTKDTVVLDPDTRRRFAIVHRKADGTFTVK